MPHTTTTPVRSDTCETLPHSSPGASASSAADARPRDFDSPPPAKERRLAEASSRLGGEEARRARLAECAAQSRLACGAAERDGRKGEDVAVVAPTFTGEAGSDF